MNLISGSSDTCAPLWGGTWWPVRQSGFRFWLHLVMRCRTGSELQGAQTGHDLRMGMADRQKQQTWLSWNVSKHDSWSCPQRLTLDVWMRLENVYTLPPPSTTPRPVLQPCTNRWHPVRKPHHPKTHVLCFQARLRSHGKQCLVTTRSYFLMKSTQRWKFWNSCCRFTNVWEN